MEEILNDIQENFNDYDTLVIGTEIIKKAKERLSGNLNIKEIAEEYQKLGEIIIKLEKIIKNYK